MLKITYRPTLSKGIKLSAGIILSYISASSFAQTYLPVIVDSRVKGLTPDYSTNQQTATFSFSCPTGPSGATQVWTVDGNVIPTPSYKAVGVGKHTVIVTFKGVYPPKAGKATFAAIGGPFQLTAVPVQNNPTTFYNDYESVDYPIYTQYFNYAHAYPPSDPYAQLTQNSSAMVQLGQLAGTTYSWTYGSLYCPELSANPSGSFSTISLDAEGSGKSTVTLTYNFTDPTDSSLSGTASDDTNTTPIPSTINMMANQVDGHEPTTMKSQFNRYMTYQDAYGATATQSSNVGFAGTYYDLIVQDELKDPMPGIWCQERFISTLPAGFSAGTASNYWTSQMPNSGAAYNSSPAGYTNLFDECCWAWNLVPLPATWTAIHQYWGATKNPTTAADGCKMSTYTITYTTVQGTGVSQQ